MSTRHAARQVQAALTVALVAATPEARALERALTLLPQQPNVPIRYVDPELAGDPAAIRRVDAFLVREPDGTLRRVIYLNRRSTIVEKAIAGRAIDVAILAAVIRHEQEHLAGAGEPEARRVEREFFETLVVTGKVPADEGLAYLRDLTRAYRIREG
jgi:hypothetical protein